MFSEFQPSLEDACGLFMLGEAACAVAAAKQEDQTIEAILVSYIDDLDAKMNIAARQRLNCNAEGEFTDKVYALDNRRLYKGVPSPAPILDDDPEMP